MKTYNKMKTTIINANAHLVCDPDNFYQYCEKSYPGYNVYRHLTDSEIDIKVPAVVNQFKGHFRAARKGGLDVTIEHLKSEYSHEHLVKTLQKVTLDFAGVRFCSNCGVTTKRNDIKFCVDCDTRTALVKVKNEAVFKKFENSVISGGISLDVRYKPGTGYEAIARDQKLHKLLPGDPDMEPPTTKELNQN